MKQTKVIMGMPITIEIVDSVDKTVFSTVFDYFVSIDKTFSTYKKDSEISRLNRGALLQSHLSSDVREILQLAEDTKIETNGYFDIRTKERIDPSGIVKGWAVFNAAMMLKKSGYKNFFIDAGGDIQVSGKNNKKKSWTVGIRHPFSPDEIIKVLAIDDEGVATSGVYNRGQHIYNPHRKNRAITDIVSMTVIGSNIYDADRFATAAFAMGKKGIAFIQTLPKFEGYMIDNNGLATYTGGFERYVV